MEKIDINKIKSLYELGKESQGISVVNSMFVGVLLAEKLNEVIDKLNKLESFTGDNLK